MASTNKTPQLGLNQWAAGDPVLREDFNADNAKLAEAVGALQARKVKIGQYVAAPSGAMTTVDVGFRPDAVIVIHNDDEIGKYSAMVMRGRDLIHSSGFMFRLTETGFEAFLRTVSGNWVHPTLAIPSATYSYIAFG